MLGRFYTIATPIGNLKDITLRAIETLKEVDVIFAEDTRVTKKLLSHYEISKPLFSYHEHSPQSVYEHALKLLNEGKNIALVTDAGTPGISDPGARLVSFVKSQMLNVKVVPIPGPSALIAALSVSGIYASEFTFLGYPPHKKGRQKFFNALKEIRVWPVVFYESTHRLQKTFEGLLAVMSGDNLIIVAKELTKLHEEIWSGPLKDASEHFRGERQKGEFIVIIPK